MLSMQAYFELLTQPDGSHRRRCCVRRIILTRTLAFGRRRCRLLQQGCCGSNTRRFHRQDRRKLTLECRRAKMAFFRRPRKNEPKSKKPRSFKKARKSRLFLKPGFVKNGSKLSTLEGLAQMIVELKFLNPGPTRYDRDVATSLRNAVNKREQQLYQEYLTRLRLKDRKY